jgi:tetratricopeptide (TPR) repeat protein
LALSYFELKQYQDALDAAQVTHEIDPTCGGQRLFEVEARSHYSLGNYDQALVYINKALSMGQYSLGYYYRGIIYQAAGKKQEAIQDLEHFLSTVQSTTKWAKEIADAKARLEELRP